MNQYGYTLTAPDLAVVEEGVTDLTSVSFTDLLTDATYTFELRVYTAAGNTSYRTALQASTLPIRQLSKPELKAEQTGNRVLVTWEAVPDAGSYLLSYSIGDNRFEVETDQTSCSIAGLAPGEHIITCMTLSDYPGYSDSPMATVTATRSRTEVGQVTGTYKCGLMRRNNSWSCVMHIFNDDSYIIDSFYNFEGYNLDFYVDSDPETGAKFIGVYNFKEFPEAEYYVLETGRASVPLLDLIPGLVDGEYGSAFTGDATSGSFTVNSRYLTSSGTDSFTW